MATNKSGTRPGFSKGAITRRKGGSVSSVGKFTGLHPVTNKAQATNWGNFLGPGTMSQKASHGAARDPKFESPLKGAISRRRRGMRSNLGRTSRRVQPNSVRSLRHH